MKKMYEFWSSASEMEMKFDEFVSEKMLEWRHSQDFFGETFFLLKPKHENLPYRNC